MCGMIAVTIVAVVLFCMLISPSEQHGYHPSPPGVPEHVPKVDNKLRDPNVVQDANHIKEHLKDVIDVEGDMSPEELEFHYFRLHDTDNNTMLDGLEILAALSHMLPEDVIVEPIKPEQLHGKTTNQIAEMEEERKEQILNYFVDIIDQVIQEDDYNGDGYLTYVEYVLSRRRQGDKYKETAMKRKRGMTTQNFDEIKR